MALRPLPTSWNLYNLVASPYFQDTLESAEGSSRPLQLFVGRKAELAELRGRLHGAGELSSRQVVAGVPGVGKTTLVQQLKAAALDDGYLTTDALVPILANDTAESVFGRVLGALYDTILVNRPHSVGNKAMRDAQLVVRADRLATGGGSASFMGFGAGITRGATVLSPGDIMIDGPRIMRDLMVLVRQADARGVLLHLNNLENLSEAEAENAAEILRSLRDPMLLHDGLHFVVVGTTEAVNSAINTHAQLRNVFSTLALEPMATANVHDMLAARYDHMRLDENLPPVPPADPEAVTALYELFHGDLRGLLKALDDGVSPLLGLAGTNAGSGSPLAPVRPLTLNEIRPMLQHRYAAHLASLPEQARVEQLTRWGRKAPDSIQTQKSLMKLWGLSQGAVSTAVGYLVRQGYVVPSPRSGMSPIQYALSGVSRIIFD